MWKKIIIGTSADLLLHASRTADWFSFAVARFDMTQERFTTVEHSPPGDRALTHRGAAHPRRFPREETRPDVVARLEWLDDLIFAAIDGNANALQAAADAWHRTREELGPDTVEESRQQYLRCARSVWYSLRYQPNHPPHRVFAAIEVISLLADNLQ